MIIGDYVDGNKLLKIGAGVELSARVDYKKGDVKAYFFLGEHGYFVQERSLSRLVGLIAKRYWAGNLKHV